MFYCEVININFISNPHVILALLLSVLLEVFLCSCRYAYPYYDPLVRPSVEAEIAASRLRRSRLEAEIATDSALRRSRIEAEIAASRAATESALRRSRVEADIAAETALRRSRIEAELAVSRAATESALRRSRIEAEIEASRIRRLYYPYI